MILILYKRVLQNHDKWASFYQINQFYFELNELISNKIAKCQAAKDVVVVACIGETLEERKVFIYIILYYYYLI